MEVPSGAILSSSSPSACHLLSLIYTPKTLFFNLSSSAAFSPRLFFCTSSSSRSRSTTRSSSLRLEISNGNTAPPNSIQKDIPLLPKIDKSGRFCSPRAARELALTILYAACLDGSDPVRLFERRVNAAREPGYEFDYSSLMAYDHMSFGGPPVTTETTEEADELLRIDQKDSDIEAEVLSAPPKLVYSNLILRFTRKLLVAVVENWDSNVAAIDKVAPPDWKKEPAGRILELSVLHLAMSEIAILGTRHQIVINEAVDLAKRFCDGSAPRIVNGCLRTFIKDHRNGGDQSLKIKQTMTAVG